MKLALVLYRDKWILGELESGLPPAVPEKDDEEIEIQPIVLRRPVEIVHFSCPVQGEIGGLGIMTLTQLGGLPLLDAPLVIEYQDVAPPWRVLEVDDRGPVDEATRRYLDLMKPSASGVIVDGGGSKRVRLTS